MAGVPGDLVAFFAIIIHHDPAKSHIITMYVNALLNDDITPDTFLTTVAIILDNAYIPPQLLGQLTIALQRWPQYPGRHDESDKPR